MAVLDTEGQLIAGRLPESGDLLSADVIVPEGRVGSVVTFKRTKLGGGEEIAFASSVFQITLISALLLLVAAVLIAIILAKAITQPVLRARGFVQTLASGKYEQTALATSKDEIGALTADLDRLASILAANRQARRRWMSDISHELRTPIASLRAELDAILEGVRPLSSDSVQSVSQEVSRLSRLVDDLHQLSLADLGSMEYSFRSVDLAVAVAEAVASVPIPGDFSCEIQVGSIRVEADEDRLHQLLTNLLANAVRYTASPGRIFVTSKMRGDRVEVSVEDSQPGVSEAERLRIVEPLYRVDASRSRSLGGSGLGLAIASSIAIAHGSELELDASSLGGLAVRFTLRVAL